MRKTKAPADTLWWSSSCGRIELQIRPTDAAACTHPGPCDDDVAALSTKPYVAAQLADVPPNTLREVLREWGVWDDEELADHVQNLQRLLWLAAGDIVENPQPE